MTPTREYSYGIDLNAMQPLPTIIHLYLQQNDGRVVMRFMSEPGGRHMVT